MKKIEERYYDGSYLEENPNWDREDSPWKANLVQSVLNENAIVPKSICEVGCGSGDVLVNLRSHFPSTAFYGYDISPQVSHFWEEDDHEGITFAQGDFFDMKHEKYDVLLLLDVIEHVTDPFTFLEQLHNTAEYFLLHIPLDLNAISVLRDKPIMEVRSKVGHIHYYTKNLALATLEDCGYEVISWKYTDASLNAPGRSIKTRLAMLPRALLYALNKDFGVRALGGETLVVLARSIS